jgi:hypothetical protein
MSDRVCKVSLVFISMQLYSDGVNSCSAHVVRRMEFREGGGGERKREVERVCSTYRVLSASP